MCINIRNFVVHSQTTSGHFEGRDNLRRAVQIVPSCRSIKFSYLNVRPSGAIKNLSWAARILE